ncbi:hypothetical protein SAMN04488112_10799 [Melghirimyces thermohalophilus]|uniref:Uncharacterized protein n=1 Tax=Melghirimyces thermohalophilus TaxID=1236220 RepID=A0A1G6L8L2_9BACL|nr:hypothetical protein SAMN04488112_10799 [Melghirimyces thermohalophilus]
MYLHHLPTSLWAEISQFSLYHNSIIGGWKQLFFMILIFSISKKDPNGIRSGRSCLFDFRGALVLFKELCFGTDIPGRLSDEGEDDGEG